MQTGGTERLRSRVRKLKEVLPGNARARTGFIQRATTMHTVLMLKEFTIKDIENVTGPNAFDQEVAKKTVGQLQRRKLLEDDGAGKLMLTPDIEKRRELLHEVKANNRLVVWPMRD